MTNTFAFIFIAMIFFHVLDDYFLQGCLANLKQKSWWEKNAPDEMYKSDYLAALFFHSLSWSFMIMIPLALYTNWNIGWLVWFIPANIVIHGITDDLKANRHKINLIQDQTIHMIQIILTFAAFLDYVR